MLLALLAASALQTLQTQTTQTIETPATPPTPIEPQNWIGAYDYPVAARIAEQEGTATVRFLVGADGRIEVCQVVETSGWKVLDDASCALLVANARFHPARDRSNRPIPALIRQRIVWHIPEDRQLVPFASGWTLVRLPVLRDGILNCDLSASQDGLLDMADDLCAKLFPEDAAAQQAAGRQVTALLTLDANGRAAPRPPETRGAPIESETVRFDVSPDGRVINCRSEMPPPRAEQAMVELCPVLETGGDAFFAPAPAGATRRGVATVRLFGQAAGS